MKKKHWLIAGILAIVTFLLGLLANSIMNRSQEAEFIAKGGNNLPDQECKNELFAPFYPRQYDSWRATADTTFRSRYMSSQDDDLLALRPEMVVLWAVMLSLRDTTLHADICTLLKTLLKFFVLARLPILPTLLSLVLAGLVKALMCLA